jgi:hypothetical protein
MTHRAALGLAFTFLLACSSSSSPPPASSSSSAPSSTPAASNAPPSASPPPAMPGPTSNRIKGMITAANTCTGIGKALPTSTALVPNGTKLMQKFGTGCGCLKGPAHYTVAYEPKTSPLRVRLCEGPGQDSCEAACSGTLEWDLTPALKDAGATSFQLVD